MLGISIYLGSEPIAKQIPYIRNMREMGFESIFTSLHIPEEDQSIYREQLQALGKVATILRRIKGNQKFRIVWV
ncbi:MupG family TIM beta-alpha barrel fold protein [Oceanobacillus alkalisoli]|uniref:MupG family TIM beta-alpha barrel fold protein n=1 Tax=Oceanobacillus alkalisoli TaxID=2925113 RepID=UPI001F11DDD1|nr:MupG family TIM beta-alpha barrel fold protein [Oceanobacillus alkalisoli]MCF3944128.1 MupG family TIM beta-alpha barrel fold protein [Oceanobacillus alkalisoli]